MVATKIDEIPVATLTEGGRRPTGVSVEDVEVPGNAKRRYMTVAYKLRVIETVKELKAKGGMPVGAYLRKEGLYYSSVRKWIGQEERGELTSMYQGGKGKSHKAMQAEIVRLRRQLERTEKKLKKTEMIVELQKKIALILEMDQVSGEERNAER
jgi:transposase-like protein